MKPADMLSRVVPLLGGWPAPVGLLVLIILHLYGSIPYQDALRTASFDLYQIALPRERVSAPVVIVDIDEASLAQFGQWPWPRSLMAQLLDRVDKMQPAAVAFDIIMPEPDRASPCQITQYIPDVDQKLVKQICGLPSNDTLLASTMKRGNAVLGVAGMEVEMPGKVKAAPMMTIGEDPKPWLRHFSSALTNVPELEEAAAGHAILSADMERGVVRRVPLVASVGDTVMPSLSLEILRLALGSPGFSIKSAPGRIEGVGVGDLYIPTQEDGSTWVHYSPHDPGRFVSAAKVLKGELGPDELANKLVLIGFSGLGLVDFPSTALGERVPGVEIHAQVLETIFDGTTLLRPYWAPLAEGAVMMLLGLSIIWGFPRIRAGVLVPVMVVVIVLLLAAGLGAYYRTNLLMDVASPIFLFVMLFGAMLADSLIREEVQLRSLEKDLQSQREQAAKAHGEMEAAMRFQMGMVPDARATFANEPRLDIAATMEPAKMVGGDLYDCFMLDEHRVFFSLGDVCGKGVPASLFMVVSTTLCKSVALRDDMHDTSLGSLMRQANKEIARNNPEMFFVTAFVGVLDLRTGELTYCNAGHEKPLIIAPGCRPIELAGVGGPPIGIMDDVEYKAHEYRLSPEEFLCVFSDGVTEAANSALELYGRERLVLTLSDIPTVADAGNVMEMTCKSVHTYVAGAEPSDDLTVLVTRWRGVTSLAT
jgi:CHASE2 domain-containing sensor protein/serine phosphatase RsbU (regulator of sigma subunit)